jgi:GAF domain-containing protein
VLWQSVVSDDANLQEALRRVAVAGCGLLANCSAASVTIIEGGRPVTVGSTSDRAEVLDDAQYSAGEGPCLTAAQERRVVRIDDTTSDERWPGFSASARANGVRSSLSVPLVLSRDSTFGGFNLCGDVVAGFSDHDEQLCQAFAAQAAIVVSNAQAYWAVFELSRNLTMAMESRAVIEQAKGVLMASHKVDADGAFELLRQRSQHSNRKLRDVARDVVGGAMEGDDDGGRSS